MQCVFSKTNLDFIVLRWENNGFCLWNVLPLPHTLLQNLMGGVWKWESNFSNKTSRHVGGQWCLPKMDLWLQRKFLFPERWISLSLITEISFTVWCKEKKSNFLIYPCPIQTRPGKITCFPATLSSAKAGDCINIEIANAGTLELLPAHENQIWLLLSWLQCA